MATTLAYIASLCTRKYTSSANAKNDVACQEFYSRLKRRRFAAWIIPITAPGAWMRRPAISWWNALAETQTCIQMMS